MNLKIRLCLLIYVLMRTGLSQECNVTQSTPFSSGLVGRTFKSVDSCYRGRVFWEVTVKQKFFEVLYYVPQSQCGNILYKFYYGRKPNSVPYIETWTSLCLNATLSYPTGPTRNEFISAVKENIPVLCSIRDFGCVENEFGVPVTGDERAYNNTDLEAVITYLHTISFQYAFCDI